MTKILFVSHCILNTASKVELFCEEEMEKEENLRRLFLKQAIEAGFQLVQLPCPEFLLYGPQRWGHVSDQFDNTFFRNYSDAFLAPTSIKSRNIIPTLRSSRSQVLSASTAVPVAVLPTPARALVGKVISQAEKMLMRSSIPLPLRRGTAFSSVSCAGSLRKRGCRSQW